MDMIAANRESMFYIANRLIDPAAHFNIKINCKKSSEYTMYYAFGTQVLLS